MNSQSRISIFSLAVISIFIISCQSNQGNVELNGEIASDKKQSTLNPEEEEIKDAVKKLLFAAGNYNIEVLDEMVSDKAMIGYSFLSDGKWTNREMTIHEYFENAKNRDLRPFSEIPTNFDIIVTEGRLALVRADSILYRMGVARNREINHFTLMKEGENWNFLNISWTAYRLPEEKRKFDLDIFAHSYAQAWCSKRPEFVASYFAETGSLQVNDGDPAKGRDAISKIAQSFMTKFPDMIVSFDSLSHKPNGIEFYWTLTGTDADPDGKGNKVNVSGFELWTMTEDGQIKDSQGSFPTEEYEKQLNME